MGLLTGAARRTLHRCSVSSLPFSAGFRRNASCLVSSSTRRLLLTSNISRLPVELSCMQSLMPFHSVTASALLNSMLSLKPGSWAWLSEGYATPL
ncbi:hypothetical protein HPP92_019504 [Vanilla planifolia]|uniref:Protein NUCLEAR FUSION DEFECTIVE 6, chloroplastic/mitochondrial n=1 Tax=Vanilla planifolia TaxID=51239 RepID=A0A835ULS3_VANPL|nr:hypothetical protein HPP92_019952 [Vanilla planifolia]KAG0465340.1 hypothetical protein HPP92_019504 [Vanilla planifolia]